MKIEEVRRSSYITRHLFVLQVEFWNQPNIQCPQRGPFNPKLPCFHLHTIQWVKRKNEETGWFGVTGVREHVVPAVREIVCHQHRHTKPTWSFQSDIVILEPDMFKVTAWQVLSSISETIVSAISSFCSSYITASRYPVSSPCRNNPLVLPVFGLWWKLWIEADSEGLPGYEVGMGGHFPSWKRPRSWLVRSAASWVDTWVRGFPTSALLSIADSDNQRQIKKWRPTTLLPFPQLKSEIKFKLAEGW